MGALLALVASAALWVDYTSVAQAFCGAGSACAKVRGSGFGYLLIGDYPLPVPTVGLAAFGTLLLLSLFHGNKQARLLTLAGAGLAAAGGVGLIALQALVIKHLCWLCLVTDSSAIVVGVAGFMLFRVRDEPWDDAEVVEPWAWVALGLLALVGPMGWPQLRPQPPVPPGIQALYRPGKINVVEFMDFECPHCRRLHPKLKAVLKDYGDRVHFVRRNYPLSFHPHARTAALAHLCAREQQQGEALAEAMMTTPKPLTRNETRRQAESVKLDMEKFDACLGDAQTEKKLEAEMDILREAGVQGVPVTFIGGRSVVGAPAEADAVLREYMDAAAAGGAATGIPGPAYTGVGLGLAGFVVFAGRRRRRPTKRESEPADDA